MGALLSLVGVPVAVWASAAGTVLATCALAGRSPFSTGTWDHGDPAIYLDLARHGFTLFPCAQNADQWCGNAGWFPAYPLLTHTLSLVGIGAAAAALALTWGFVLGTLVLLWTTFLDRRLDWGAAVVLLYVAFGPSQIYGYAMYPLSMLVFLSVLFLWLMTRARWLGAGLAGAALVLTYPVGIVTPLVAGAYLLFFRRGTATSVRRRQAALAAGPPVAALVLYFAVLQIAVGHWDAYLLTQHKYDHHLRTPLGTAVDAVQTLFAHAPFALANVVSFQEILVTAVVGCVLVDRLRRRRSLPETDMLLVLWMVATWLIPVSTSHLTYSRGEAGLLPAALLVAKLPRPVAAVLVLGCLALVVPMEVSFLHDLLN